jgi:ribosomal protein S18 acetylase RimI-like enzyme
MSKKKITLICISIILVTYFSHTYFNQNIQFQTLDKAENIENYQQVKDLHSQCFAPMRRTNLINYYTQQQHINNELSQKKLEQQVDSLLKNLQDSFIHTSNITLLRQGSEIIGIYSCSNDYRFFGNDALIWNVCLDKKYRGQGKGRKLAEHAISRCKKDYDNLLLTVEKENTTARNLYQSLGFKKIDWPQGKPVGLEFFNKILMKYTPPRSP